VSPGTITGANVRAFPGDSPEEASGRDGEAVLLHAGARVLVQGPAQPLAVIGGALALPVQISPVEVSADPFAFSAGSAPIYWVRASLVRQDGPGAGLLLVALLLVVLLKGG
jgi:hypothetical protein